MRRSALRGKRKIRIGSRAQKDTIMIQKNTQKDYECHSNDSCVKILFAPINSPLEAMRHPVKHWSLSLLLFAVASGVFAFTKNFFHLVAFRCPFDLVPLVYPVSFRRLCLHRFGLTVCHDEVVLSTTTSPSALARLETIWKANKLTRGT